MGLSEFSQRLSAIITDELDYTEDKKEIVAYGIENLILTLVGFLSILIAGFILGALFPAAVAAVFGGLLRRLSGGAHFNTPLKCLAMGAVVYSLLGVISKQVITYDLYNFYILLLVLIMSLILAVLFAPVDSEAKPIHSVSLRRKLKGASIVFIFFSVVLIFMTDNALLSTSAVMGVGYQSITLLPVFNRKKKEV